mmetsp:Transcript_43317/g.85122  ORF Transcript_43317/g.85122 Transcript_43317/m.85122 type:complete len:92 (-) Transcript_43317:42-317(-)
MDGHRMKIVKRRMCSRICLLSLIDIEEADTALSQQGYTPRGRDMEQSRESLKERKSIERMHKRQAFKIESKENDHNLFFLGTSRKIFRISL